MNWTLEVVPIPVTDVDAAKAFYVEKVGFHLDHDVQAVPELRVVPTDAARFGLLDRAGHRH